MDGKTDREVRSRGFSLLEVLITVLVLSLGLLGLASLQIAGLRDMQSAFLKGRAVNRAYQIVDLMRANRRAARNGAYDNAFGQNADGYCGGVPGNAESDLCAWERAISETLPEGAGSVDVEAGVATVCVRWAEPYRSHETVDEGCGGDVPARHSFELRAVL